VRKAFPEEELGLGIQNAEFCKSVMGINTKKRNTNVDT
jgi:hypothetical protein